MGLHFHLIRINLAILNKLKAEEIPVASLFDVPLGEYDVMHQPSPGRPTTIITITGKVGATLLEALTDEFMGLRNPWTETLSDPLSWAFMCKHPLLLSYDEYARYNNAHDTAAAREALLSAKLPDTLLTAERSESYKRALLRLRFFYSGIDVNKQTVIHQFC